MEELKEMPVGQFVLAFEGTLQNFAEGTNTQGEVHRFFCAWTDFHKSKLEESLSTNVVHLLPELSDIGEDMPKTDKEVDRVWLHKGNMCASEAQNILKEVRYGV